MNDMTIDPGRKPEPEEEQIRRLLSGAGARGADVADDLESVRAAARSAWRARYGARVRAENGRGWRWVPLLAAAAVILAVASAFWLRRGDTTGPAPVTFAAAVEVQSGSPGLLSRDAGSTPVPLATGAGIPVGSGIATPPAAAGEPNRLALSLVSGGSLRIDAGTALRFEAPGRIRLDRGSVYFDSRAETPGAPIEVVTSAGTFRDLGTQFEVHVDPDAASSRGATRLRVREGRVAFAATARAGDPVSASPPLVARRGEQLSVAADGGIELTAIEVHGAGWRWIEASAPPLAIEGLTARRFLDWLARERGWTLEFAGGDAAAIADRARLHGSIDALAPSEAPEAVLATCGLTHRVEKARLIVAVRTAS